MFFRRLCAGTASESGIAGGLERCIPKELLCRFRGRTGEGRKDGRGKARACLKIAFRQMCVTICGRFDPNEGGVVGYVDRMRAKYTAKWGVHLAGMNFRTRSRYSVPLTLLIITWISLRQPESTGEARRPVL